MELDWLKLGIPSTLAIAWMIRLYLVENILNRIESLAGLSILTVIVAAYEIQRQHVEVLWNESEGLMVLVRPFTVEVCSARLLTSVPVGLDLKHSARSVLRAMSVRYDEKKGGEVKFFFDRPLDSGVTRVGMCVSRSAFKGPSSSWTTKRLADQVVEDALILEGSMRAAYPHTPIEAASMQDTALIYDGGLSRVAA
jgi:hypothetical protein